MSYDNSSFLKIVICSASFAFSVNTKASEVCDLTEEFAKTVLQKRLYENQSKYTAKSMLRYAKLQLADEKHSEYLSNRLNSMLDSAYHIRFGKNSAENKQIIANFARDNKSNCLAEIRAKEKRLEELKARKRELERELAKRNQSRVLHIETSKTGYKQYSHIVFCGSGEKGTIVKTNTDLQWIDKNGKHFYSNTSDNSVNSIAKKICR